jgi:5-methylcytosine-specific restriction endonuclease McrA
VSGKLSTSAWQRLRQRVIASTTHCYLCRGARGPLDPTIRWPHDLSVEVDHVHPRGRGGQVLDPTNLRPVHRICNREKGVGHAPAEAAGVTTRQW